TAKSSGAGFESYTWPKPGQNGVGEKTAYVRAIPELGLIVGSGAYVDDIFAQTLAIAMHIALVVTPLLLLFLGAAYLIGHTISRRLQNMTSAMHRMAQGDYDIVLPGLNRQDELGEMSRAVEDFKIGMREAARVQNAQRSEQREAAERARSQEMKTLAQKFESAIGGVVDAVAG